MVGSLLQVQLMYSKTWLIRISEFPILTVERDRNGVFIAKTGMRIT